MSPPSSATLHGLVVLAAALLAGSVTLGHGIVFDDHALLGGNHEILDGRLPISAAFSMRYWGRADEVSPNELYRPVTVASLAIGMELLGSDPWGMHAVNVSLHALNGLLVYLLSRMLFGQPVLALLTSLIFALHPVATEAVAPVSGRADLLACFLVMAASIAAVSAGRSHGWRRIAAALGAGLATWLAVLSKENAIVTPALLLLVLQADRLRGGGPGWRSWGAAGALGSSLAAVGIALGMRVGVLGYLIRSEVPGSVSARYLAFVNNPLQFADAIERVVTALRVALEGIGILVFPLNLSADYSYNQIPVGTGWIGAAAVAAAAAYLAAIVVLMHRPVFLLGLGWPVLTYLIGSNLIAPIGTIFAERLLYLPVFGFALLAAHAFARLSGASPRTRPAAIILAAALLVAYGFRSIDRYADWADDERLFAATVLSSPDSAKAHSNHGFTLQRAGRNEEAIEAYLRAVAIAPGLTGARVSAGQLLMNSGRNDEALVQFGEAALGDPAMIEAWRGMAETLWRAGREDEAIVRLAEGLPRNPAIAPILAEAHFRLGARMLSEGNDAGFMRNMEETIALDPGHGRARFNLALDALKRGDIDRAREHAAAGRAAGYVFPPGFLESVGLGSARQ